METLSVAVVFLVVSIWLWINYTLPFVEKYGAHERFPSRKIGILFALDFIKAVLISYRNKQKLPFSIKLHGVCLVSVWILVAKYLVMEYQ